ncbi:hypothetical protein TNCT_104561 [Trichonephila clavata]|uniref:Uncharacterized protein n=1 Tax=Trichonephila clavata TaxID=2740835 RepID=A0A8X6I112_TRICU|nr:hypothetical protein TNCT_104561 [Trichonephila clavata]
MQIHSLKVDRYCPVVGNQWVLTLSIYIKTTTHQRQASKPSSVPHLTLARKTQVGQATLIGEFPPESSSYVASDPVQCPPPAADTVR